MKYLKYTPHLYLIAGFIFAFKAITLWNDQQDKAYLFVGITFLAFFMFFFRSKYAKKMENRNKNI